METRKSEIRGIAYLRRSTGKQERSLAEQLDWVIERSRLLGVHVDASQDKLDEALTRNLNEVGDLYFDDAISGADASRPGFAAFHRRAMKDGNLTHCFAWSRDRFARPELVEEAVAAEKKLLYAGRHMIVAKGVCCQPRARFEDKEGEDHDLRKEYSQAGAYLPGLSMAVLRGQAKNASTGHSNGGQPVYGFVRACARRGSDRIDLIPAGETRRGKDLENFWIPGEDEESLKKLDVVRRIFRLYHARTHGLGRIARALNEEGIPSPKAGQLRKDPRTARLRPVSGKWTVSNVRGILQNPLYMAEYAWGRTEQGRLYRFQPDAPEFSRVVRADEVHQESGEGKKRVERDYENWFTGEPARPFEPIVPKEDWLACNELLKEGAKQGGLRGKPHHRDPDKYPIAVVCENCGERMSGAPYGGEPCYICSSYVNSKGEGCCHAWVQRDVVVGYALRSIQRSIEESGSRRALREAIKELLVEERSTTTVDSERQLLEQEVQDLLEARRRAYADMQLSKDPAVREDAQTLHEDLAGRHAVLARKLKILSRRRDYRALDVDAEVDAALGLIDDLHGTLDRVSTGGLRELFTGLGAEVRVRFEPGRVGQRRIIPTSVELRLGQGGFDIPALTADGDREALGIDGRGERIRTSDFCNPIRPRLENSTGRFRANVIQVVTRPGVAVSAGPPSRATGCRAVPHHS